MNLKSALLTLSLIASFSAFAGIEVLSPEDLLSPARANDLKAVETLFTKSEILKLKYSYIKPETMFQNLLDELNEQKNSIITSKWVLYRHSDTKKVIGFILHETIKITALGCSVCAIVMLAVDEAYKQQDYEAALMHQAVSESDNAGCCSIHTEVINDQTPYQNFLINLHTEMKFRMDGETLLKDNIRYTSFVRQLRELSVETLDRKLAAALQRQQSMRP